MTPFYGRSFDELKIIYVLIYPFIHPSIHPKSVQFIWVRRASSDKILREIRIVIWILEFSKRLLNIVALSCYALAEVCPLWVSLGLLLLSLQLTPKCQVVHGCTSKELENLSRSFSLAATVWSHLEDPLDRKCCSKELGGALYTQ